MTKPIFLISALVAIIGGLVSFSGLDVTEKVLAIIILLAVGYGFIHEVEKHSAPTSTKRLAEAASVQEPRAPNIYIEIKKAVLFKGRPTPDSYSFAYVMAPPKTSGGLIPLALSEEKQKGTWEHDKWEALEVQIFNYGASPAVHVEIPLKLEFHRAFRLKDDEESSLRADPQIESTGYGYLALGKVDPGKGNHATIFVFNNSHKWVSVEILDHISLKVLTSTETLSVAPTVTTTPFNMLSPPIFPEDGAKPPSKKRSETKKKGAT